MRTAVVTTVHGRHDHLQRQQTALQELRRPAGLRIVVAMDDPAVANLGTGATVVSLPPEPEGLPLAAARNAGARRGLAEGAELVVFLDVDCLPGPGLLSRYRAAARTTGVRDTLLCGPVAYLPPPPPGGYRMDRLAEHPAHPARPVPGPRELRPGGDHRLFWSLSFAATPEVWHRIGGFCPDYVGYGAEDTDFAMLAQQAGVGLSWVGGAEAYHQWHPTSMPPVQHLGDILRNGAIFRRRWGWWPMEGWMQQFHERGLVVRTADGGWAGAAASREPDRMSRPGSEIWSRRFA